MRKPCTSLNFVGDMCYRFFNKKTISVQTTIW
jgi:hypothetical protein